MKLFIRALWCVVLGTSGFNAIAAEQYPSRPIKVIVGYSPGGAVDLIARSLAQSISGPLGQPLVVENKPGAGTNIAIKQLIDSPADGYTLMLAANALAANGSLYKPAPFDLDKDIAPIALVGKVPVVIATSATSNLFSIKDLLKQAQEKPGELTYGSPGNGATPHMAMKFFEQAAGVSLKHIPYKGGALAITDVIGGQIDIVVTNMLEVAPLVKSGKLRLLAVMSAKRSSIFPAVPTVAESGYPGFEAVVWYGLIAPAKTPNAIIARLHSEVEKSLGSAEMKERLNTAGGEVTPESRSQFASFLKAESRRYQKLVREAGIVPD